MNANYKLVQESGETNYPHRTIPIVKVGQIIKIQYIQAIADDPTGDYITKDVKAEVMEIRDLGNRTLRSGKVIHDYDFLLKCDDILPTNIPLSLKYGANYYVVRTSNIAIGNIMDDGTVLFELPDPEGY